MNNYQSLTHGDEVALQVLAEKPKYLQFKGYWCTQSTGPGLFMETHDWGEYPSATFRTYRHRGRGAIIAGEAVIFYYPKDIKWMTCDSKWCFKNTCPGSPTISHGVVRNGKHALTMFSRSTLEGESWVKDSEETTTSCCLLYSILNGFQCTVLG